MHLLSSKSLPALCAVVFVVNLSVVKAYSNTATGQLYNDDETLFLNVPINLTRILQIVIPKIIEPMEVIITQTLQKQHEKFMDHMEQLSTDLNNVSDAQNRLMVLFQKQEEKLDGQQRALEAHKQTFLAELKYLNQSIKTTVEPLWVDFQMIQAQHHAIDIKLDLLETQLGDHQKGQDQLSSSLLAHDVEISKYITTATDALLCSLTRDNSLRLADGGRVEVKCGSQWGTVCHNGWSSIDARVVCRQLGLSYGNARSSSHAAFGQGTGPIWLANVACTGSEKNLWECEHNDWGINQCGHHMDAGVVCQ